MTRSIFFSTPKVFTSLCCVTPRFFKNVFSTSVNSSEQQTSSFRGIYSTFTVFLIISFLEKFIFTCFVCY